MKKIIALLLLTATPASSQTTIAAGSGSSGSITIPSSTRTCTVNYKGGQISTSNCDFSRPLSKPRFFPADRDELMIEFDQPTTTNGYITTITPNMVQPLGRSN